MAYSPRVLSLDGGGIRGLSTLKILEEIMENIRQKEGLQETPLPRDYFDLIGGTSTGGIIAIMLGRLGMSVDASIRAYKAVGEKAFTPKHFLSLPAAPKGFYSATALVKAIKQVIKEQCQEDVCRGAQDKVGTCEHEDKLFRDQKCCKTVALAITKDNVDARPTLFATYDTSTSFKNCTICEVVRATSAATTFFKSIKCGRDEIEFIDAGFGYNNPCEVLIEETKRLFPEASEMRVLSIGTGLGDVVTIKDKRLSILKALKTMASSSKKVADRLDDACGGTGNYFRFNVDRGLQDVTLADWEKSSNILAHTLNYVNDYKRDILQCAVAFSTSSRLLAHRVAGRQQAQTSPASANVMLELEAETATRNDSSEQDCNKQNNAHSPKLAANSTIFDIPLDTNKNYVERKNLVRQLDDLLHPTDIACSGPRRAALYGLGGSGKTELVTRFAEMHRERYSAAFWVNATDSTHLLGGFSRIAMLLGIGNAAVSEASMDLAREWLTSHSGWLLVIDNIDEDDVLDLLHRRILRAGMTGTILITGRIESIKTRWNAIEVSNMEAEEALALLRNITGSDISEEAGADLLKDLGHLPLAIDQAATFMGETGKTAEQYRRLFNAERSFLLKKYPSTQYNVNGRESVMTTWEISFKRVKRDHPQAATLLLMFALLHYEEIPFEVLESCFGGERYFDRSGEFGTVSDSERWIPDCLPTALSREISLVEEIAALRKYSFVRSKANSSALHIHPLVHFWASQRLENEPSLKTRLLYCILGLIASAFEKQDRLPPLCSRTYGSRGLEEAKLGIWPWRRYTHLSTQALHCLRHAKILVHGMPKLVKHLTLSLLQVFEYSTYQNFDTDQQFILSLLDAADDKTTNDDSYLKWSLLTWRLVRADLCKCRKHIRVYGSEISRIAMYGEFCKRCKKTFGNVQDELLKITNNWEDHSPRTSITRCLVDSSIFRLAGDPFWKYYCQTQRRVSHLHSAHSRASEWILGEFVAAKARMANDWLPSRSDFRTRLAKLSWAESYGISTRRYLILRSQGEYDYSSGRVRSEGGMAAEVDRVFFTPQEPMDISQAFRHLCGGRSEEFRRAAFYASFELSTQGSWDKVEDFLRPLVLESVKNPSTSWSHERCIIRFIEALVKQKKDAEAREMVLKVEESYKRACETLLSIEKSALLRSADEGETNAPIDKDIQIFIKTITGRSITVNTNTCATVRSVIDSVHESEGLAWGESRLIYGGKQLETHRFLSDYNIQKEATVHLVLRMAGGETLDLGC